MACAILPLNLLSQLNLTAKALTLPFITGVVFTRTCSLNYVYPLMSFQFAAHIEPTGSLGV
jgi:hypothetical protein